MTPAEQELAEYQKQKAAYVAEKTTPPKNIQNLMTYHSPTSESYEPVYEWLRQQTAQQDPAFEFDTLYADWAARNNTPAFQDALAKYNSGELQIKSPAWTGMSAEGNYVNTRPVQDSPFSELFGRAAGYFQQGQFAPGSANGPLLVSALNQWEQDNKPGFLDKVTSAIPAALGGLGALVTGLGPVAAGALTGAAGSRKDGADFGDLLKGAAIGGTTGYAASQIPGLMDSFTGTSGGINIPSVGASGTGITGDSLASFLAQEGGTYPGMLTDAAINTAVTGAGTGAAGSVVPSMFAPSMTEAALGVAGLGAAGSALYPSPMNFSDVSGQSSALSDFLSQEGGGGFEFGGGADSPAWYSDLLGGAKTALGSVGMTGSDLLKLAPAALGYMGSKSAADSQDKALQAQKDLAARYEAMGAPYRTKLSDLYSNPNAYLSSEEVQKPVQQASDIMARSLSTRGNPVASGNALQQLQSYSADQLFGRLGQEKDRLAGFGGLTQYQGAAPGIASGANAINPYDLTKWKALGAGADVLDNIFDPKPQSGWDEYWKKQVALG